MGEIADMYREYETSNDDDQPCRSDRKPMEAKTREWLDSDGNFLFGKCKGESVEDVAMEDPSYLRWILENVEDIDHEDRDIIESALQFRKRSR